MVKKNSIWSEVVQEQTLCEGIANFNGLTTNNKVKREVESYDVQKSSPVDKPCIKPCEKKIKKSKNKKKKRLGRNNKNSESNNKSLQDSLKKLNTNILNQIKSEYTNKSQKNLIVHDETSLSIKFDESKNRSYIKATEFDSDEIVCKEIVKHLEEQKSDLISKFNAFR